MLFQWVEANRWFRFFAFFTLLTGGVSMGREWFGWRLLPQANRFQVEFEMAFAATLAYLLIWCMRKLPVRIQTIAATVLVLARSQAGGALRSLCGTPDTAHRHHIHHRVPDGQVVRSESSRRTCVCFRQRLAVDEYVHGCAADGRVLRPGRAEPGIPDRCVHHLHGSKRGCARCGDLSPMAARLRRERDRNHGPEQRRNSTNRTGTGRNSTA